MSRSQSFLLLALLALFLAAVRLEPRSEWLDDLILAGYILVVQ